MSYLVLQGTYLIPQQKLGNHFSFTHSLIHGLVTWILEHQWLCANERTVEKTTMILLPEKYQKDEVIIKLNITYLVI